MLTGYLLLPVYLKERQDTIYVLDEEKVSNKVVYSMIHPELFFSYRWNFAVVRDSSAIIISYEI